jgi:hypothetical protein
MQQLPMDVILKNTSRVQKQKRNKIRQFQTTYIDSKKASREVRLSCFLTTDWADLTDLH